MKKAISAITLVLLLLFLASNALALQYPFGQRSISDPLDDDPWDILCYGQDHGDENDSVAHCTAPDFAKSSPERSGDYPAEAASMETFAIDRILHTIMTFLWY